MARMATKGELDERMGLVVVVGLESILDRMEAVVEMALAELVASLGYELVELALSRLCRDIVALDTVDIVDTLVVGAVLFICNLVFCMYAGLFLLLFILISSLIAFYFFFKL